MSGKTCPPPLSCATPRSFPYSGPPELEAPITAALQRVVDPEVALSIVDVGLVYGVAFSARGAPQRVQVLVTMTSAACPVVDAIIDEIECELDRVVPPACAIEVELVWEPPWTQDRMSERARRLMAW